MAEVRDGTEWHGYASGIGVNDKRLPLRHRLVYVATLFRHKPNH